MPKPASRWFHRVFKDDQYRADLHFFRGVSIFHGMTSRQLGRIMQSMQKRVYRSGEKLFLEGQVGRAVFIVKSGKVELTRKVNGGKVRRLGVLGPGQIFGEMALLENRPRTASATVVESGEIHLLYTATVEALIQRHAEIGVKLLKNMAIMLSALLRKTNNQIDSNGNAKGAKQTA